MILWLLFSFVLVIVSLNSDAYPVPVTMVVGPHGNPVMFLRDKSYPQRTMMFTGYYRPIRRTGADQATAVFAQGNSVRAGTYLKGDFQPNYLQPGPEPVNEPEPSNVEHEPASQSEENFGTEYHQNQGTQNPIRDQPQSTTESYRETTFPKEPQTEDGLDPPKKNDSKKGKKVPRPVKEEDDDEEYEDEDDASDEIVPFVPMKGKRRYNIFFPMMFRYPSGATRSGSSGTSGSVTAIANSYSTGKGGVANSVATAYGESPQKKSRRPPTAED